MNKKFVNRQNVYRFYRLTYELVEMLENKQKTDHKGRFEFWQGHLCNLRVDEIKDLLQFGKEIKIFLSLLL